ncbi:hypothetical protein N7490_005420 [Penicillium lividum]|nr:hypothetical protein N7490_005420 [Penicillium lividum]
MTENEDLLSKIGRLAGQINRHKNQSSQPQSSHQSQHVARHAPSHPGWAPYSRGRGRPAGPHRHRTLILNNGGAGSTPSATSSPGPASDNDGESRPPITSGWVAKRDRHMQLINSAVYDKEQQVRAKAMEETRKFKEQRRAEREQSKVLQYAQGSSSASVSTASQQILVNDVPFKVVRGGSKLVRVSSMSPLDLLVPSGTGSPVLDDPNSANTTPKRVTVAGVTFVRSKNGNLHRLGAVALKKQPGAAKKRDELCKRFTTTGTCYMGPSCRFTHDPTKVAICKDFLQTGTCSAGTSCDLSHEPSPHRSPACVHFMKGRCSNDNCRYGHIRTTPGAPVCRGFATLGYCEKGALCEERHVHECPDYANSGVCHKKRCQLPHVDRAGQIRKAAAAAASKAEAGEDDSDQSSEEEDYDAIDSDDVDSDEFDDAPEELIAGEDGEMLQQQDFIRF